MSNPNITTVGTPDERLDRVGAQYIINLVANGGRLRTKGRSLEKGILNEIDVSEFDFTSWMSGQTVEVQQAYYRAVALAAKNITSDVLHHSLDVIDEIDEMIEEHAGRGPTKTELWKLKLLEMKHKVSNDTLRQIASMQRTSGGGDVAPQLQSPEAKNQPSATVVTSQDQQDRINLMRKKK